jgi:CO/xanthine dehydrogenase Mo-binding subunit
MVSGAVAAPIAIANAIYDATGVQLTTITAAPDTIASMCDSSSGGAA